MNKDFIKIKDKRIRKNTIKKYEPRQENKLQIFYNTSRYKVESEIFEFPNKKDRDNILDNLDSNFGIDD